MKFNFKTVKVILAFAVIIAVIFWGINLIRPRSYSGTDLNFSVGGGPFTITNPSDEPIPVQFTGTGSVGFTVSSDIDEVSGRSEREGSGSSATQFFNFELPPGESKFTIARGTNVAFTSETDTSLQASVVPVSTETRRTTIIAMVIVTIAALFYASNETNHRWLGMLRGQEAPVVVDESAAVTAAENQGRAAKTYGDNRSSNK